MRQSIQETRAECERLRARMVAAERECERHRSERDVESRLNRDRVEALQSECDVAQDEARKATARADDAERRADNLRASHDHPRLQDVARIDELEAECERRRARERELVAALALADKVMADTVTEERRLLSEECERLRAAIIEARVVLCIIKGRVESVDLYDVTRAGMAAIDAALTGER